MQDPESQKRAPATALRVDQESGFDKVKFFEPMQKGMHSSFYRTFRVSHIKATFHSRQRLWKILILATRADVGYASWREARMKPEESNDGEQVARQPDGKHSPVQWTGGQEVI